MSKNIFKGEEIKLIKEKMASEERKQNHKVDIDTAFDKYDFILSQMSELRRARHFYDVEEFCEENSKDLYEMHAYYALKIDQWLSAGYIVDITCEGFIVFPKVLPNETDKYLFKVRSSKMWTKESLEEAFNAQFEQEESERE